MKSKFLPVVSVGSIISEPVTQISFKFADGRPAFEFLKKYAFSDISRFLFQKPSFYTQVSFSTKLIVCLTVTVYTKVYFFLEFRNLKFKRKFEKKF